MNDFKEWINPKNLSENNTCEFKKTYERARPFKHLLIKDFLKENKANLLLKELKGEKFIEKEADLFNFKQTDDLYFTKNKVLKKFNNDFLSWDYFNFMTGITGKKFKGTLDMAGTLYESTSFLLPHDDELEGRKIAYIIYLAKNFSEKDGGNFILYNSKSKEPTIIAKKYPPLFNSLLMFEVSEISFHEVEENMSKKNRYALGGWLH